jgi:transposase
VTQFSDVVDELLTRWSGLGGEPNSLTVTYDAGQNSKLNHTHIETTGVGFVTSLPPSQHRDLLAVAHSDYTIVDEQRFEGLTAYDTTTTALGVTRRAIITHSQTFHDAQTRSFEQTLGKARRQLTELQQRLARSATRKTATGIDKEIDQILAPRWLNRVITATVTGNTAATRRLTWHVDTKARRRLEDEYFGKRILFTNRNEWTITNIVAAYRSQSHVEASFRQLKDPKVVSFSPMFHWTDHKIRVHTFTCVLALQIAHLMTRRTTHAGLDLSVRRLLDTLAGIQETVLLYQGDRGRPRAHRIITDLDPTQKRLYNLFNLDRYAPRR